MPMIIHPVVTGTITIEMSIEEAKTLIGALDGVLQNPSHTWMDKTLRDEVKGDTCNQFLRALQNKL